jgi:hypothetical protein
METSCLLANRLRNLYAWGNAEAGTHEADGYAAIGGKDPEIDGHRATLAG